jgi:hypothetical protein
VLVLPLPLPLPLAAGCWLLAAGCWLALLLSAEARGAAHTVGLSAVLVGCSVEWEIAALTMAFLGGAEEGSGPKGSAENRFHLQGEHMMIKCYHKHVRVGGTKIASAYLEVA